MIIQKKLFDIPEKPVIIVDTLLCGVCSNDNKIALTVNEVKVCYDCLKFNKNRAKGNGLTEIQQLEIDTKYISLNAT